MTCCGIAHEPLESAIIHSVQVVGWSALWMAAGLILIAAVDAPIQLWESHKKLLMTKQEVRDEHKDQEGRPEVKQRIRQLQREMSQRKMMASVPDADVVITTRPTTPWLSSTTRRRAARRCCWPRAATSRR